VVRKFSIILKKTKEYTWLYQPSTRFYLKNMPLRASGRKINQEDLPQKPVSQKYSRQTVWI